MAIKKQYSKTKKDCKVTFLLPFDAVGSGKDVYLVGDFNNWNTTADKLNQQEDGNYSITINLKSGKEYQFRYLIDGMYWENDWNADKYIPSPFNDTENSVVAV